MLTSFVLILIGLLILIVSRNIEYFIQLVTNSQLCGMPRCKNKRKHDFEVADVLSLKNILDNIDDIENYLSHFDYVEIHIGRNGILYKSMVEFEELSIRTKNIKFYSQFIRDQDSTNPKVYTANLFQKKVCLDCGYKIDEALEMENIIQSIIERKIKKLNEQEERKERAKFLFNEIE